MFTYGTYYQRKHSPCCTNTELLRGPPGACCSPKAANTSESDENVVLSTTVTELSKQVKQLTNLITLPIIDATENEVTDNDDTLSDQVSALTAQVTNLTTRLDTITISNNKLVKT